jgi:hypothetical protein
MNRTLAGKRIELIRMEDPYTNLKEGDKGTIQFIDDIGQIHVKWDNGSTLAISPEIDEFNIIEESLNKLRHVRLFEEFILGSDIGYINTKMEELSDLVDSIDDEFISFEWSLNNNLLNVTLEINQEQIIIKYDIETGKLIRNIKGKLDSDQCDNVEEAMDIIEDCIYNFLGVSERAKTKGEKYKGKHIPAKYLTSKKDAMKKEIEEFRGKKKYKKDWEADIDKRSGKRIETKKSAATKAYHRMFEKKKLKI